MNYPLTKIKAIKNRIPLLVRSGNQDGSCRKKRFLIYILGQIKYSGLLCKCNIGPGCGRLITDSPPQVFIQANTSQGGGGRHGVHFHLLDLSDSEFLCEGNVIPRGAIHREDCREGVRER